MKFLYKVITSVVIFNKEGKFLLQRRSLDEDVLPGYWGVPGGKVELRGAMDDLLEIEAKREVKEEVGLEITNLKYFNSHMSEDSKIIVFFTADYKEGEPKPLDGTDKVGWYTLEDIGEFKLTPNLENLLRSALRCKQ
jgi:8-oxo-dGTP diphosphatase